MKQLITTINYSFLNASVQPSGFLAKHLELDLLLLKIEKALEQGDFDISIHELSLDGIHVARCSQVGSLSELKTLLEQVSEFASNDFILLNRAIGAFDNSTIKPSEIKEMVDVIAPIAYKVSENFTDGVDIRDKDNYTYIEVGKGILIGIPKSK